MEQRIKRINDYFREQMERCSRRCRELLAEERQDEAYFEKIKANVYDIFRAVLSAAEKVCGKDPGAVEAFFLKKLEEIQSNWQIALEKAKMQNDTVRMEQERIKLCTAGEIKEAFAGIWRVEP